MAIVAGVNRPNVWGTVCERAKTVVQGLGRFSVSKVGEIVSTGAAAAAGFAMGGPVGLIAASGVVQASYLANRVFEDFANSPTAHNLGRFAVGLSRILGVVSVVTSCGAGAVYVTGLVSHSVDHSYAQTCKQQLHDMSCYVSRVAQLILHSMAICAVLKTFALLNEVAEMVVPRPARNTD